MRLLSVRHLEPQEFNEDEIPPYAILSHTWRTGEELTFADLARRRPDGSLPGAITRKTGFSKAQRLARVVARAGYHYIWIDSCCINKDSSSELQEAINSMFKWYEEAVVCCIYLEDFEWVAGRPWEERFQACRWFTRGWTLQELVAPQKRFFFDKNWTDLGQFIPDSLLNQVIAERTNIPLDILTKATDLASINTATKMRWAAGRQTTRGEDMAYSLLGIFDVNMPLLYGQGRKKAFLRLQEEIIRNSDDETIFAWQGPRSTSRPALYGLFAESPAWFVDCEDMVEYHGNTSPWTQTNKGLRVSLLIKTENMNKVGIGNLCHVFLNQIHRMTKRVPSFDLVPLGEGKYARTANLSMVPGELMSDATTTSASVFVPQERPNRDVSPPLEVHFTSAFATERVYPATNGTRITSQGDGFLRLDPEVRKFQMTLYRSATAFELREVLGDVGLRLDNLKDGGWAFSFYINTTGKKKISNSTRDLDREFSSLDYDYGTLITETVINKNVLIKVQGPRQIPWFYQGAVKVCVVVENVRS